MPVFRVFPHIQMIEFYRDWPIWLSLGDRPSAIIRPPGGGDAMRVERACELELFEAVVDLIDQAFIDEHVPTVDRADVLLEIEAVEMTGAEL